MSSCAASSCMFCPAASCASATSASLPTAGGPVCCRFASSCCTAQPETRRHKRQHLPLSPAPAGGVPSVVAPCTCSNGSLPPNFGSALHRKPPGVPHDRTSQNALRWHRLRRTGNPCSFASARRSAETLGAMLAASGWPAAPNPMLGQHKQSHRQRHLLTESAAVAHSKYISA